MNNSLSSEVMPPTDYIRVFLRDCAISLRVGIYTSEMDAPQPVVINIELEASLTQTYDDIGEKDTSRIIDYERLYNFITQDLPKLGHICLLEALADQIIAFCFQDARVRLARVSVEKTQIFAGVAGAGIELTRTRKGAP